MKNLKLQLGLFITGGVSLILVPIIVAYATYGLPVIF